jgi:hypothetical protein
MSNGTAFDVDNVLGQAELAGNHDRDGCKRLVDLGALNGADLPAGALQRLPVRNTTALAISSGAPNLPSGIALEIIVLRCSPTSEEDRSQVGHHSGPVPG